MTSNDDDGWMEEENEGITKMPIMRGIFQGILQQKQREKQTETDKERQTEREIWREAKAEREQRMGMRRKGRLGLMNHPTDHVVMMRRERVCVTPTNKHHSSSINHHAGCVVMCDVRCMRDVDAKGREMMCNVTRLSAEPSRRNEWAMEIIDDD